MASIPKKRDSNKPIIIGIAAAIVIGIVVIAGLTTSWFGIQKKPSDTPKEDEPPDTWDIEPITINDQPLDPPFITDVQWSGQIAPFTGTITWEGVINSDGYFIYMSIYNPQAFYPLGEERIATITDTSQTSFGFNINEGGPHYFYMTSYRMVGEVVKTSIFSNVIFIEPVNGLLPAAPTGLTSTIIQSPIMNPGKNLVMTWNAANGNGNPILKYNIYNGTTYFGGIDVGVMPPESYTYTFGLWPTFWEFSVRAVTITGEGPAATLPRFKYDNLANVYYLPDPPTNLIPSAKSGPSQDAGGIYFTFTLSWTAPAYNGGSPITQYKIYKNTSTPALYVLKATSTTTQITLKQNEQFQVEYYVSAVNSVGESVVSTSKVVMSP